jgi:hypothetical protein
MRNLIIVKYIALVDGNNQYKIYIKKDQSVVGNSPCKSSSKITYASLYHAKLLSTSWSLVSVALQRSLV